MHKQNQLVKTKATNRAQAKPASLTEEKRQDTTQVEIANYSSGLANATLQSGPLGNVRLPQIQRQALASQVGQAQGNRYLQRMLVQRQCTCGSLAESAGECTECRQKRQEAEMEETTVPEAGLTVQRVEDNMMMSGETVMDNEAVTPLPDITGEGEPTAAVAFANSIALQGRTEADFDGGTFRTLGVKTKRGTDCNDCPPAECVTASGTVESTFHVNTTVTLPSVSEFPDLTPCQQRRVQAGITNVLAPHEQQHVAAFRQYNGVIRQSFSFTTCRSEFDARIQALHDAAEQLRHTAAQAASDRLDPFNFEVDINCTEPGQPHAAVEQDKPDEVVA